MNGSPMVEPAKDTELSTTYPGQGTQPLERVFHLNCEQPTRVVWMKHSLNRGKSRAVVWKIDDKKNLISLLSQSHCFTVSICMTAFLWWVVPPLCPCMKEHPLRLLVGMMKVKSGSIIKRTLSVSVSVTRTSHPLGTVSPFPLQWRADGLALPFERRKWPFFEGKKK